LMHLVTQPPGDQDSIDPHIAIAPHAEHAVAAADGSLEIAVYVRIAASAH
jgi:hypothetical protein